MPIGVIVAVAIVCIVVAVLSSAQRADIVAVDHEKQLFSRAITNYGERVLREVESVASAAVTIQNIRRSFDPAWAKDRVGNWLETYFDHDYVFIFDRNDELIYSLLGSRAADAEWMASARNDFASVLEYMRGRDPRLHGAHPPQPAEPHRRRRASTIGGDPPRDGQAGRHRGGRRRPRSTGSLNPSTATRRSSCR